MPTTVAETFILYLLVRQEVCDGSAKQTMARLRVLCSVEHVSVVPRCDVSYRVKVFYVEKYAKFLGKQTLTRLRAVIGFGIVDKNEY